MSEILDGYTIKEWQQKYFAACGREINSSRLAGERLKELHSWNDAANKVCRECGIFWPNHADFAETIIAAFKERMENVLYVISRYEEGDKYRHIENDLKEIYSW